MASVALTPSHARFGNSFSGSIARPDLESMADQLPSINFGFDDLRERMSAFTARFDEFIERGRKRVLEERNQFRLNVVEIQDSQRARKREIESIQNKSVQHQNTVEKEEQEQEEMHEAIHELNSRRGDHLTRRDELKIQIVEVQQAIDRRRRAQKQHQMQLDSQASNNGPELRFWETSLCLRMEGTGVDDQLRFIYTHVDEKDWDRECMFELSMEKADYEVLETRPSLDRDSVQAVLDRLNETRDLAGFLKSMRLLCTDTVKH